MSLQINSPINSPINSQINSQINSPINSPINSQINSPINLPIDSPIKSPIETGTPKYHPRFQNPGKNTVSSIIGGYKSAVTKHANRLGLSNGWQSRFYDHIIRDDADYQRIKNYISNNISNWKLNKFY